MLCATLGAAWWFALLIPELSRQELLGGWSSNAPLLNESQRPAGSLVDLLWGFSRVVAVVAVACVVFDRLRRRWPKRTWLLAAGCYWAGTTVYAATLFRLGWDKLPAYLLMGPFVYFAFAWYITVPVTALTALALIELAPSHRAARRARYSATPSRSAAGRSRTVFSKDS